MATPTPTPTPAMAPATDLEKQAPAHPPQPSRSDNDDITDISDPDDDAATLNHHHHHHHHDDDEPDSSPHQEINEKTLSEKPKTHSNHHGEEEEEEEEEEEVGPHDAKDAQLTFPEGGRGWLCVVGGFICTFCTFGYANSAGVFFEFYQSDLLPGTPSSTLAWVGSLQYFLLFAVGSVTGRIFDAGYYRPMLAVGIFLYLLGQCMLSLSTHFYQVLICQGILLGLSYGAIFQVGVTVPQQWFHRRRAAAMGLVAAGSSTGGIIFPIAVKNLIPRIGFPWTMRVIALLAAVLLAIAFVCLKTRLPPSLDVHTHGWGSVKWFDFSVFRQAELSLYTLGAGLTMLGLYSPFTYIDLWTETRRIPANGYWLSVMNAASMFGRILPGFLADRVGRTNTLLPHLFATGILLLFFPLTDRLVGMLFFAILYGFASGSYVSLIPAAVGQLGPMASIGTRLGMVFAGSSFGGLLGTPIAGAILGSDNANWWGMSIYSGVMVLAGAACVLGSRTLTVRRTGSQRI